jgi:hypothetical protein
MALVIVVELATSLIAQVQTCVLKSFLQMLLLAFVAHPVAVLLLAALHSLCAQVVLYLVQLARLLIAIMVIA